MKKEEIDNTIDRIINETDFQEQIDILSELFDNMDYVHGNDDDFTYFKTHNKREQFEHVIEFVLEKFQIDIDNKNKKSAKKAKENDEEEETIIFSGLNELFKDKLYSYELEDDVIIFKYDTNEITYIEYHEELTTSILAMHFFSNFALENILINDLKNMLYSHFELSEDAIEISNTFIN